jgi:hypothetical protein
MLKAEIAQTRTPQLDLSTVIAFDCPAMVDLLSRMLRLNPQKRASLE